MKFERRFDNIKLIISDFDGVFTDGTGIIDEDGRVSKRINYHDVLVIALVFMAGIKVAIITGEEAGAVKYLAGKFPDMKVFQGIKDKLPLVKQLAEENNLKPENILYVGDDVNDFQSLNFVGVKVTVPNSNFMVKSIPDIIITEKRGGEGVFREITDAVLYEKLNARYAGEIK
ncbi:MAG: HAD hydrolase family protein [Candidatus Gastranaerophilales bacterium]|nr:HAD hydrolase family protein [Candidatus Gastranaerophilales bacterium]